MTPNLLRPITSRLDARVTGSLVTVAGLGLLCVPLLAAGALGLELLAGAFWLWARASSDRLAQVPRWAWLRRPAAALWLATAASAVVTHLTTTNAAAAGAARTLVTLEAVAVLWAGLELLAALPLERPYSDRPGPLLAVGPWLPLLLPAAGFAVLWTHADAWRAVPIVRESGLTLLLVTQVLASLRAFGRRRWVATLRWLALADSAVAGMLIALGTVAPAVTLGLWTAAFGGRAALLAGELHGAEPRRRAPLHRLWRLSGWLTSAALAWPLLVTLLYGRPGLARPWMAPFAAGASLIAAWVSVRRMVEAPERRSVARRESALPLGALVATLTLLASGAFLGWAWWQGFQSPWPQPLVAAAPSLTGGLLAWWLTRGRTEAPERKSGAVARAAAHGLFGLVTVIERWVVGLIARIGRTLLLPLRDLHTGDAQEYLLFLLALSVLALVLPLLR
jgi:hypothetical protein